jgi:CubicO group peptidase (beta-lactamase class C family)
MHDLLARYGIPGAVLGILHNGQISVEAAGVADVTTGEPVTTGTVFQCGSMTKTWTALAFMQLVDEGKVSLDEPVRTYLPGFRVADAGVSALVTPRHLLFHTGGIEEDFGDPGEGDDVCERMVAGIAGAPQVHPLGHTHGYSAALGYAILARIMEVVDGKRWDDVMRDRLFVPLGLTDTGTLPRPGATGHLIRSLDEGPFVSPIDHLPRCYGPGGNLTSTAREVLTMARVLLDGASSPAIREMMHSRVAVPDPYLFGPEWALGLIVCDWNGTTVYASDGSTIGQHARLRILPSMNLAIVLLANGGPREPFYKEAFGPVLASLGAPAIPPLPAPSAAVSLDVSRYVGSYGRPGIGFSVTAEDGRLFNTVSIDPWQAEFMGRAASTTYDLLPVSPTHFLMPPAHPLEDTQTVALYDFVDGRAQYLHTNCRVHPRTPAL